jgi:hypothetical protein
MLRMLLRSLGAMAVSFHRDMVVQDDFGSLRIPCETEDGALLHYVDHPALSPKLSEKSQASGDLEFRSGETTKSMDDALGVISILFAKENASTLTIVKSNIHATDAATFENAKEPIRKTTNPLRPPGRFPRRIWIGLTERILMVQKSSRPFHLA